VLSDYLGKALAQAAFEKLEDCSYGGRIPPCLGVVAFRTSLRECESELRSTVEDWILVGLHLKDPLPVVRGIELNKEDMHG
jgi:predicted RNase H-like HicB family nuclease